MHCLLAISFVRFSSTISWDYLTKVWCFVDHCSHRTNKMRTYAFFALLLPLASACYQSQCFTKAEVGTCVPLAVSQLALQYQAVISRDCIPLYGQGWDGATRGHTCLVHALRLLNLDCRIRYGNKCIVYLGLSGLVSQSCNPTVTVEGIPLNQWIVLNKNKKGGVCPLQFKFPGINKSCAPPPKKVAGKAWDATICDFGGNERRLYSVKSTWIFSRTQ